MLALRVTFDLPSLRRWVRRYEVNIDRAMRTAMTQAAQLVADEARARHAFTNRTGKLEKSIKGARAVGSFMRSTLRVEVIADTPYARFVEEKITYRAWAYLRPARDRTRAAVARLLNDTLAQAVRRGR